mgnify:CR=1 FL=1
MEEIPMNKLKHAAAKKVFAGVADYAVDQVHKNPEAAYERLIDTAEKPSASTASRVRSKTLTRSSCRTESSTVKEIDNPD